MFRFSPLPLHAHILETARAETRDKEWNTETTGENEPTGRKKQMHQGAKSGQEPPGPLLRFLGYLQVLLFLVNGPLSASLLGINTSLFEVH